MTFVLCYSIEGDYKFKDLSTIPLIIFLLSILLLLIIFTGSIMELIFKSETFDEMLLFFCCWIFGFSIIISEIIRDVNIVVASATILLVIVTAYSIYKTNEIAQRQLKLQNDPIISLSLKENEDVIQIIDLVIENVGNGIAKNIRFKIHPKNFITLSGDSIDQLFLFQRGIQILPPKQKYIIHLVNYAKKIQEIRKRNNFPFNDNLLTYEQAQNLRTIVRCESELEFIVYFENNEGELMRSEFNFNLSIFWGLRFH